MSRIKMESNEIIKDKKTLIAVMFTSLFIGGAISFNFISKYELLWRYPIVIMAVFVFLLSVISDMEIDRNGADIHKKEIGDIPVCIISSVIVLLGQITYWLAYYPGGFNLDAYGQWQQVHADAQWDNWHPILSTLIYWLLTRLVDSLEFCILFQLILFAISIGYLSYCLIEIGICDRIVILISFIIAIDPAIGMNNICLVKDVYFVIGVIWFGIITIKILEFRGEWLVEKKNRTFFTFITAFVIMIRHNGLLFVVPFYLYIVAKYKKTRKSTVINLLLAMLLVVIVETGFLGIFSVKRHSGVAGEMVGLPMAAMANAYVSDFENAPKEVINLFDEIASRSEWEDRYILGEWDSCRWILNCDEIVKEKGVIKIYKLFWKTIYACPKACFYSIIANTRIMWQIIGPAYWIPEVYIQANEYGIIEEHNAFFEMLVDKGIGWSSLIPVTSIFWNTGVLAGTLMVAAIIAGIAGKRGVGLMMFPVFCYAFGTMNLLCGPNFRYFYYIHVIFLPYLSILLVGVKRKKSKGFGMATTIGNLGR